MKTSRYKPFFIRDLFSMLSCAKIFHLGREFVEEDENVNGLGSH